MEEKTAHLMSQETDVRQEETRLLPSRAYSQ
jgi:hypothetical protein